MDYLYYKLAVLLPSQINFGNSTILLNSRPQAKVMRQRTHEGTEQDRTANFGIYSVVPSAGHREVHSVRGWSPVSALRTH